MYERATVGNFLHVRRNFRCPILASTKLMQHVYVMYFSSVKFTRNINHLYFYVLFEFPGLLPTLLNIRKSIIQHLAHISTYKKKSLSFIACRCPDQTIYTVIHCKLRNKLKQCKERLHGGLNPTRLMRSALDKLQNKSSHKTFRNEGNQQD